jgi:hypothetical protein
LDLAALVYNDEDYTRAGAERLRTILSKAIPSEKWAVIAEDDHFHIERSDAISVSGQKNRQSNYNLEVGDMQRAQLGRYEWGDDAVSPPDAVSALLKPETVHKAAASMLYPGRDPNLVARLQVEAPALADRAAKIATVRELATPPVRWVDIQNGRVIADSLGAGNYMQNGDIQALVKEIANGMPVFEPQVFPFNVVDAVTFDFFPAFALEVGNGGPLPAGAIFRWVASHIRISNSVLNANPGLQVQVIIDFSPALVPGAQQSMLFELGDGTIPTILSPVHGAIAAGLPRMNTPQIAVQAGVPLPGVNFPRVRLIGAPTATYQAAYRYMIPGDAPTNRFRSYMA